MLARQTLLPTESFPRLPRKSGTTEQVALAFISSLGPFHRAYFSIIHQKQGPDGALEGLPPQPAASQSWETAPLFREGLLSWLLFSLYHGPRQLSFVLCLNTEWQSTNRTWKNFGLSFCKSYCIKCVVKMAEWPIVCVQGNSHRITMDLEGSLKRNEEAATQTHWGSPVGWGGECGGSDGEKQCC